MSWFLEEHKIYCYINISLNGVGVLFFKRTWYFGIQLNHLEKPPSDVKQIIHAKDTYNLDYVMTCINTIPPTSNTLKHLVVNKKVYSSYIQTKYNNKEEIINNTFITYVESLLDDINHPVLLQ